MTNYKCVLALLVLSCAVRAPAAMAGTLLLASAHDQIPAALGKPAPATSAVSAVAATLDRQPVSISWGLDAGRALDAVPATLVQQSREFWSDVSETELRAGVKLTTSSPAALIRISPAGGNAAALDPGGILIGSNGRFQTASAASSSVADGAALRSAGMDAPAGSLAFRLAGSIGAGELQLSAPNAQGRYLIHVFEPDSPYVLSLNADHDTVLGGSRVVLHVALAEAGSARALSLASGLVSAPDGYSAALQFSRNADGSFDASFSPDAAHSVGPQLWEAHAFTAVRLGRLTLLRDARTAFAVSAPTARFAGAGKIGHDAAGVHVGLVVDTSNASRYQVSGVLYGHASDGTLQPLALAQAAAWLPLHGGQIELGFDSTALASGKLAAPYELRDLRLVDQATMSVIERRERALVIAD